MKRVMRSLKSKAPVLIETTFFINCLITSKDQTKIVFGSKKGRIGVVDTSSYEVVQDETLSPDPIRCICLSQNEAFLFTGGDENVIKKYTLSDLNEVDSFVGHTDRVN